MRKSGQFGVGLPGQNDAPLVTLGEVIASSYRIAVERTVTSTGVVFGVEDMPMARPAALKLAWRGQAVGTIIAEARRCSVTASAGAATIYAVGTHRELEYAVAEHLEGESLSQQLATMTLNTPTLLKRYLRVAQVVAEAHAAGVAVGELSADTLLVTPSDRIVLGRFSLSQVPAVTAEHRALTPEVARGAVAPDDPAAAEAGDIYRLGALAIELATGKPLFAPYCEAQLREHGHIGLLEAARASRESNELVDAAFAYAHGHVAAPHLTAMRADVPSDFADLVEWMLAKHPAARPASAADIVSQLQAVFDRLHTPRRMHVLVVAGELADQRWLANLARRASAQIQVETAADGGDAVRKLNRDQPDFVMIATNLQGQMNALEFAMYARGLPATQRPAIAMVGAISAYDQALLDDANTSFIASDYRAPQLLLDLIRAVSTSGRNGQRAKRISVSG